MFTYVNSHSLRRHHPARALGNVLTFNVDRSCEDLNFVIKNLFLAEAGNVFKFIYNKIQYS